MTELKDYFRKRVLRFRKAFALMEVDGFIIENPTDIAYFTGLKMSRARLLISRRSGVLFVDGRYTVMAEKDSPFPVKKLGEKELGRVLKSWKGAVSFGFDTELSIAAHRGVKSVFAKYKKSLKGFDQPTQKVRAVKDSQELACLKKSATLLWEGFEHIRSKLKVGVSEIEIARAFEFYVKKKGAEALSFDPIVAFGENSALPHYHSGIRTLKKGDVVLIDIGVVLDGYASDMTRIVFFGKVSKQIQKFFQIVKKAHGAALKQCREGALVSSLDKAARAVMGKQEKYFVHALGHGIGLDVHEYPRISSELRDVKLEAGMVITIEPGLYLPEVGGIRYEDMVVITKTGYRNLFQETKP